MPKPHKVTFSAGYDDRSGKYRHQRGEVIEYLLNEMVRVRLKDGTERILYKSEYNDTKNKRTNPQAQG
jgi:hypothetical protein